MPLKIRLPKFGFFSRKALVICRSPEQKWPQVEGDACVDLKLLKASWCCYQQHRIR